MAMIEKIRRQGWLVLVMVGLGMIGFLVPYDAVMAMIGRGNGNVGEIDGETITGKEWQDAVNLQKQLFSYNGNEASLSNDTWNAIVENKLMTSVYNDLGLEITDEEFEEILYGEILSPYVKQTLYGGVDSASYRERLRQNFEGMNDELSNAWKKLIISKRQREKFDLMVKKGVYSNSLDGKWAFKAQNDKLTVKYVVKTYAEIPDSTITWTESDIKAYYNKHKNDLEYKQETSRSIEYIKFPVTPSSTDSAAVRSEIDALITGFKAAANDSSFAMINATTPGQAKVPYKSGSLAEPWNTQIMTDTVGDIVGPYVEGNSLKIARISKRGTEVDSVQARHILLTEKEASGRAKADSLKKEIAKNNNFAELAAIYGTDGTKDKGGDLGMFGRGNMVKPFEDACFNGKLGEVQIVETQFGVHLVEVTKKNAPQTVTYISVVDRPMEASAATRNNAFQMVNDFCINYSDSASFRNAADTLNGGTPITPAKNIKPNATSISGLSNAQDVVSWAYQAELGDVSSPKLIEGQWVVALLTEVKERGVPSLENVYDKMKEEVIKEKKAEKFIEMMKSGTLEEIAAAVGSTVRNGENITMKSSNIPGSGVSTPENEVIGACFGMAVGTITSPIVGKGGVYVIQKTTDVVPGTSQDNYATERQTMATQYQNRAAMQIFNSFKEEAQIEDNRYEQQ